MNRRVHFLAVYANQKCRRNDGVTKLQSGNHHSNNSFKKQQQMLKFPLLLNDPSISF